MKSIANTHVGEFRFLELRFSGWLGIGLGVNCCGGYLYDQNQLIATGWGIIPPHRMFTFGDSIHRNCNGYKGLNSLQSQ